MQVTQIQQYALLFPAFDLTSAKTWANNSGGLPSEELNGVFIVG
jgi:hypothetical protein